VTKSIVEKGNWGRTTTRTYQMVGKKGHAGLKWGVIKWAQAKQQQGNKPERDVSGKLGSNGKPHCRWTLS